MADGRTTARSFAPVSRLRGAMVVVVSANTSMAIDTDKELFVRTYEENGREILIAYTASTPRPRISHAQLRRSSSSASRSLAGPGDPHQPGRPTAG